MTNKLTASANRLPGLLNGSSADGGILPAVIPWSITQKFFI